MHYIIYCDESAEKGRYFSNFYGGSPLRANDRELIESRLLAVKAQTNLKGELKWTKISTYNEEAYRLIVDEIFEIVKDGLLKLRIMFTQNINQNNHIKYDVENEYFMLYYQFVKHAFGLRYCNPQRINFVDVSVFMDDVPQKADDFDNFKNYMSGLSDYPIFHREKIRLKKHDITDVDSSKHIILQMVDIILGSMNFRLNGLHLEKADGSRFRGKRTRAKERVYKYINARIREIYPGFNIGASTGQANGDEDRWRHPYRHWCFVPKGSKVDLTKGKNGDQKK